MYICIRFYIYIHGINPNQGPTFQSDPEFFERPASKIDSPYCSASVVTNIMVPYSYCRHSAMCQHNISYCEPSSEASSAWQRRLC